MPLLLPCRRLLLVCLGAFPFLTSPQLRAADVNTTLSFTTADQAAALTPPADGAQNSVLVHVPNGGPGGTGSLRFDSTGEVEDPENDELEHRFLALHDPDGAGPGAVVTLDSTQVNQWTTSLKVRMADLEDTPADTKAKAGARVGFLGSAVIANPAKPQESLNKPPQTSAIFADFKIEWENSSSSIKQPKLSVEVKSWNGSLESKPSSKLELTFPSGDPAVNAHDLDGWYQVSLTITRTALTAADYLITGTIHNLGDSGTAAPILVGTHAFVQPISNAPFSTDTTLYPFFLLETDKKSLPGTPGSSFEVDDYAYSTSATPGPQPPPPPPLSPVPGGGPVGINVHLPFENSSDFDLFTYTNQNLTTVGYASTNGTGTPAGGAGVFQTTSGSGSDKRVFAHGTSASLSAAGPGTQEWNSSLILRAPTMTGTPVGSKYKAHTRFGFLASAAIPDPAKPQDLWKQNTGIHADFKIEWENTSGKLPTLSIEAKSSTGAGQETKTPSKFETATFDSTHWFQGTLHIRRIRNTTDSTKLHLVSMEASIYDLGPDGTGDPVLIGTTELGSAQEFVNESFSTAPSLRGSFMLEGEKGYAGTPYYNYFVDDLVYQTALIPTSVGPVPDPVLTLALTSEGLPLLTWPDSPGWLLQSSPTMGENSWTTHATATSPHAPAPATKYFFRLIKP